MATIYVGSARHDEFGKYIGGKAGDQKQVISSNGFDMSGEVSVQTLTDFVRSRRWYIVRPKQAKHAKVIAQSMLIACNNKHLGYDQTTGTKGRLGVVEYGVDSTRDTEADCGTTIRACIKRATGQDVGAFTTANEVDVLQKSGLFEKAIPYKAGMRIYEGDIFVTQSKGHTGACISGYSRDNSATAQVTNGKFIFRNIDMSPVFDPDFYRNAYPDVVAVYGVTPIKLFEHFCNYGMNEGRQACDEFNVHKYKNNLDYDDLRSAYKEDLIEYYVHYAVFGKREGRVAI